MSACLDVRMSVFHARMHAFMHECHASARTLAYASAQSAMPRHAMPGKVMWMQLLDAVLYRAI